MDQVLDDEGNILSQHDSTPIRQVISEETSAKVRQCLEYVVAQGTGKNGQVAGYRIGGKTGTADKTETKGPGKKPDLVVSFMSFAPADDPQYIMLLTLDTPSRTTGTYPSGGNMVAPTASQIMAEILPYLGIEPDYTAEQLAGADAAVPNVVGKTAADAKTILESAGFSCKTVGSGETVSDQPPAGALCCGVVGGSGDPGADRRGTHHEGGGRHLVHLRQRVRHFPGQRGGYGTEGGQCRHSPVRQSVRQRGLMP